MKLKNRFILLLAFVGVSCSDSLWMFKLESSFRGIDNAFHQLVGMDNSDPQEEWEYQQRQRNLQVQRVRSVLSQYAPPNSGVNWDGLAQVITTRSELYGFDPMLVLAIIQTESNFEKTARSNKGAMGLMQVLPTTAFRLSKELEGHWRGTKRLFEPEFNVDMGTLYLSKMMNLFGDLSIALEAYNQGPGRVQARLNTGRGFFRQYSREVMTNYRRLNTHFPA